MEDVRLFMEFNLDGKISLLYPKQIPEPHIPGAYVLALGVLLLVRTLSFSAWWGNYPISGSIL